MEIPDPFEQAMYVSVMFFFWDNSEFLYILVVNNNKYLLHVVDNYIFGISVPNYSVEPLKAILYDYFGILYILFTLYSYKQQ